MTTREHLIAARRLIDTPEKWGKHGDTGVRCAMQAIWATAGFHSNARVELAKAIDTELVTTWNDAPERTHADVMAAFDKAIAAQPE